MAYSGSLHISENFKSPKPHEPILTIGTQGLEVNISHFKALENKPTSQIHKQHSINTISCNYKLSNTELDPEKEMWQQLSSTIVHITAVGVDTLSQGFQRSILFPPPYWFLRKKHFKRVFPPSSFTPCTNYHNGNRVTTIISISELIYTRKWCVISSFVFPNTQRN